MSESPAPPNTRAGGRGTNTNDRGRFGRGGRSGRGGEQPQQPHRAVKSTFKGATPEMNGHVFQCYDEHEDRRQYSKTLEALQTYIKKTLKFPEDMAPLFADTMTSPKIDKPQDPGKGADDVDLLIYNEEVKEFVKWAWTLKGNLATVYAVAWGQCSEAMKVRVKAATGHKQKSEENDCVWLFKQIKSITVKFDEKKCVFASLVDA